VVKEESINEMKSEEMREFNSDEDKINELELNC
jgi:hypothetical protein